MRRLIVSGLLAASALTAPVFAQDITADTDAAIEYLRVLSADDMDGRRTGSQGAADARAYIAEQFFLAGLLAYGDSWEQEFSYTPRRSAEELNGVNLVGYHPAASGDETGPVIVVTAHYDHLGNCGGQICNGADDNASGVAALIAVAEALRDNPPAHTIIFAALDAEENGLNGARALVADLPVDEDRVVLNINFDMLAINADNELPAAGAFHFPFLHDHVEAIEVAEPTHVIQGYDSPEWGPNGDWTYASDHAAFHDAGIPWIYYGVDFHEYYHQPTDEFEVVQQDFFASNVQTVLNAVVYFDENLDTVAQELADFRAAQPEVEEARIDEDGRFIKPGME